MLTIDANGIAKAGKIGTTRVTATHDGITAESTDIQVTGAKLVHLNIFPVSARSGMTPVFQPSQVAVFTGLHLVAYGFFSDGSFQDITRDVIWNTSDNTTASIDTTGFVIGMKPGQVQVTATMKALRASLPLTVTGAKLQSVKITPGDSLIPNNSLRQYTLTGTFDDGTQEDLTQEAIWLGPTPLVEFGASGRPGTRLDAWSRPGGGAVWLLQRVDSGDGDGCGEACLDGVDSGE